MCVAADLILAAIDLAAEDGALEQVLFSHLPLSLWVLGKVLAHTFLTGGPLLLLAHGMRQVASGDLTPKYTLQGKDELGGLTRSFALMTQQLADARQAVELSMGEVDAARANLQTILDNLTAGVIVLDAQGLIHSSNPGATRILRAPMAAYEGPINSAMDIHILHSDSAVLRSEITAPKQLEFANGNLEFPEGIDIQLFNVNGLLETTLRADRGFFMRDQNLYRGEGDVQVKNLSKDQRLQTEEIFWNQAEKKIYTEKFVTIQERQTIFNGTGMEADDSFSNYRLKKVRDSRTVLPGEGL